MCTSHGGDASFPLDSYYSVVSFTPTSEPFAPKITKNPHSLGAWYADTNTGPKQTTTNKSKLFYTLLKFQIRPAFKASTNESSLRHRPVTTKDRNCTEDSDFPPSVRICRQPKGKPSRWQTLSLFLFRRDAIFRSAPHHQRKRR